MIAEDEPSEDQVDEVNEELSAGDKVEEEDTDKKPPTAKQGKYEKAMEDLRVKYMPKG